MIALTKVEIDRVLEAARNAGPRACAMVLLAYLHGMRASEICKLRMSDVDLSGGTIVVKRLKGSDTNLQKLSAMEISAIRAWFTERGDDKSPYVFTSRESDHMNRSTYFRVFQRIAEVAGLPEAKAHPHVLKHARALTLLQNGMPINSLQKFLGHKSLASTGEYLKVNDEQANLDAAKADAAA